MPCTYYETPGEIAERRAANRQREQQRINDLNRLTHENDMLREILLDAINTQGLKIDAKTERLLNVNQEKHRKEDLARLKKTFKKRIKDNNGTAPEDFERLGRVEMADPKQPLEPQLGFDPDEF